MFDKAERVLEGMKACNGKCRKCKWRDGFSGMCRLLPLAIEYVDKLERDNAQKMVYCKDCLFCEITRAQHGFETDKYECRNRDGLPVYPSVNAMDYCSRGKAKNGVVET